MYDLELKDSGKKLFVTTRGLTTNEDASRLADNIFRYEYSEHLFQFHHLVPMSVSASSNKGMLLSLSKYQKIFLL